MSPPISIHIKHLFSGCHNGNQTQNNDEHVDQQTCIHGAGIKHIGF